MLFIEDGIIRAMGDDWHYVDLSSFTNIIKNKPYRGKIDTIYQLSNF